MRHGRVHAAADSHLLVTLEAALHDGRRHRRLKGVQPGVVCSTLQVAARRHAGARDERNC